MASTGLRSSMSFAPMQTPSPPRPHARIARGVVLAAGLLMGVAERAAGQAQIPLQVVGGRLCARMTLVTDRAAIPGNVVIDLGLRAPLLVHTRTAEMLGIGRQTPVTLRFERVTLADVPGDGVGIESLEELTRDYSAELGELPAFAVMGLPALADYVPQLDLAEGALKLLSPTEVNLSDAGAPAFMRGVPAVNDGARGEAVLLDFREEPTGYYLAGTGPEAFPLRVRFTTAAPFTFIDATVADMMGSASGAVAGVRLGGLDVTRYVALRPEDLAGMTTPPPDLVVGTDLLACWRVTISTAAGRMLWEPSRTPEPPLAQRAFYDARSRQDADGVEVLLPEKLPPLLAGEAADLLIAYRLEQYPVQREAFQRALRLKAVTTRPERRAETLVRFTDELLGGKVEEKAELATDALNLALTYTANDLNARSVHDIHARLGMLALQRDDLKEARRNLLSAAFGLPRDPVVLVGLGELYERSGKSGRAWSRYAQAALGKDPPVEAMRGLNRLNRDAGFRAAFTMADAEELLAGRGMEFHPAERWTAPGAGGGRPCALIELFTSIDEPMTLAAELAFGGLTEYFEGTDVALVEYHVPTQQSDPLVNEVAVARGSFYGIRSAPVALFDGGRDCSEGGDDAAARPVFETYMRAGSAPRSAAVGWRLAGQATFANDAFAVDLTLDKPASNGHKRLFILLCEKLVMATGANGLLLHRNVARASLSPVEGYPLAGEAGTRRFEARVGRGEVTEALERSIGEMESKERMKFVMRPTYVDAGLCFIVVIVQDAQTKAVEQARVFNFDQESEPRS